MSSNPLGAKVALVTGSSSGMGRAIALALADKGAKLMCCDMTAEANPAGYEEDVKINTHDLIVKRGGVAIFQTVDISDLEQLEAAFARAVSEFGRLDINVNCAGYWAPFRSFVTEDDALWAKMVAINTMGTAKAMRLAIAQFLKQDIDINWGSRGRIVNISSCAANIAFPGEVAYSATKASINHMTRAGALDHARDSVNINCIAPGMVATGTARRNIENKNIFAVMQRATPWPRIGTAGDIAGVCMFLLLPQSQWMTGQILAVDGGMTLGIAS